MNQYTVSFKGPSFHHHIVIGEKDDFKIIDLLVKKTYKEIFGEDTEYNKRRLHNIAMKKKMRLNKQLKGLK